MTVKVVELIVEILDALKNKISMNDLTMKINAESRFDKQTISAAFSLIFEKSFDISKELITEVRGIRIFSEEEKLFLGYENINYLLYLVNNGLNESFDLEQIIEQLSFFPNEKITKEEINLILLFS